MVDCSPAVEGSSVVPPVRQCAKRVQRDAFVKNVKRYVLKRVPIQRNLRDKRHVNHKMTRLLESIVRSILTIGGAKSLQFILISVACSNYPPAPSSTNSLSKQFAGTHLSSSVERATVRVKCLARGAQHNDLSQGLNPDRSIRSPVH